MQNDVGAERGNLLHQTLQTLQHVHDAFHGQGTDERAVAGQPAAVTEDNLAMAYALRCVLEHLQADGVSGGFRDYYDEIVWPQGFHFTFHRHAARQGRSVKLHGIG